MMNFTP